MPQGLSIYVQLGRRVCYLRGKAGLTQLDLSLEAGLAKSYVSEIEAGKRNPSLSSLSKMAKGLGVSLEELLRGIDDIGLPSL